MLARTSRHLLSLKYVTMHGPQAGKPRNCGPRTKYCLLQHI